MCRSKSVTNFQDDFIEPSAQNLRPKNTHNTSKPTLSAPETVIHNNMLTNMHELRDEAKLLECEFGGMAKSLAVHNIANRLESEMNRYFSNRSRKGVNYQSHFDQKSENAILKN